MRTLTRSRRAVTCLAIGTVGVTLPATLGTEASAAPSPVSTAPSRPLVLAAQARDGIVLLDPRTGRRLRLVVREGEEPALSPDGARLAFTLREGPARHVWVSDLHGRQRRRLTSGPAQYSAPDWSPSGRHLAMCRRRTFGSLASLALIRADGTLGHVLPNGHNACDPSWSPDGTLLAFTRERAADEPSDPYSPDPGYAVHVVGVDGRNRQPLVPEGSEPDWAPEGRRLAMTSQGGDDSAVDVVELPSLRSTRLTPFSGPYVVWHRPRWSPDGQSVYAGGDFDGGPPSVHRPMSVFLQRLRASGEAAPLLDVDRVHSPSVGGGPPPPRDRTPPGPVTVEATVEPSRIRIRSSRPADRDQAGVVVRYAPGVLPPAHPGEGLPAGRSLSGGLVLSRLPRASAFAVSVWPVDWSGNVGPRTTVLATTPAEVATSLRLVAEQPTVPHGTPVRLSGRLIREDTGTPVPAARVALWNAGTGREERLVARLVTGPDGRLSAALRQPGHTTWTVRYDGAGELVPARASVSVRAQASVTTTLSARAVRRGQPASLAVQVRPATPGARIDVQQGGSGASYHHTARQDRDGRARVALRTDRPGRYPVYVQTVTPEHDDPYDDPTTESLELVVR